MKIQNIIGICVLMIVAIPVQAQIPLTELSAYYYNELFEVTSEFSLQIKGVDKDSNVLLVFSFDPTMVQYSAYFTEKQRSELLSAIQKYKEWRTIALNNKVKHTKDISTVTIFAVADHNMIKKTVRNSKLTFRFVSGDITNHYFYFLFHEASTSNMFINIVPDAFFLDYQNVLKLETLLQDPNLNQQIKTKISEQQNTDALFQ